MRHEISCGAVVYKIEDGALLFLVENMKLGHTSIPKGHMEQGETREQTACREIREETGLEVTLDTGFSRTVTYSPEEGVTKDVIFFVAAYKSGTITPQACEVTRAEFLPAALAEAAMTYDSDREVLRQAAQYIRNQQA